jgi:hypothetical protein
MGREIKRVPVDFDWPVNKTWHGFLMPDDLHGVPCRECGGGGWSPRAKYLHDLWYGRVPFRPEDNGSTPLTPDTPAVREFAERNVKNAPEFYGAGETAIRREARRLAGLWNGQWSHHLNAEDVAALVAEDGALDLTHDFDPVNRWTPKDPPVELTPEMVNAWSIRSLFGPNSYTIINARCVREGVDVTCRSCDGHGHKWRDDEHKAAHEAWEPAEPPEGDGWQLWETVSEGSPISPVFPSADGLIEWMTTPAAKWGASGPWTRGQAERFVNGPGWAPTFMSSPATGLVDGVTAVAASTPQP